MKSREAASLDLCHATAAILTTTSFKTRTVPGAAEHFYWGEELQLWTVTIMLAF